MTLRTLVLVVLVMVIAATALLYLREGLPLSLDNTNESPATISPADLPSTRTPAHTRTSEQEKAVSIVAENLEIPWDIAFLPEGLPGQGGMLVTERPGRLRLFSRDGSDNTVLLSGIGTHNGEGGLLGVAVHPDFDEQGWIYLYISEEDDDSKTVNSVWQYWLANGELITPAPIITGIPGAPYHDGGRIEFGPDDLLYITTGDATEESLAQDIDSLAGKILRIDPRGEIPSANPFGSAVYSYGHRNPQGLAWDSEGRLWETEHGRSGVLSGLDEINVIHPGENYGWPEIQGDETREGMVSPALESGASTTWAPASAAIIDDRLFFGGLRGETLYEAILDSGRVVELKEHFKGEFGRIRTVRVGPDGYLYLTTSNRDGRLPAGRQAASGDDKIIRVDPALLP